MGCPKGGKSAPQAGLAVQKMSSEGVLCSCLHLTSISRCLGLAKKSPKYSKSDPKLKHNTRFARDFHNLVQAGLATCLFDVSARSMPWQKVQPLCSQTPIFHLWCLPCFVCFNYECKPVHSFKTESQSLFFSSKFGFRKWLRSKLPK